jgi:uncharacterized protein (DUF2336 family)
MVDLCDSAHDQASPEQLAQIEGIFLDLVQRAEQDIRIRLAERLATAAWAPAALINVLAMDDIDIARPIIAKSPVLQNHDLIRILAVATIEHHIEVARRPGLPGEVVKVILDQADPVVLTTLAGNTSADVSLFAMTRLLAAARGIAPLRAPLSRRPELNLELASLLYGWAGETLRSEIASRFSVDGAAFEKAVRQAAIESVDGAPPEAGPLISEDGAAISDDHRLIAKLEASGQLRPGFLLRTLREGKLRLFELGLSTLTRVSMAEVSTAINSDRADLLAMACADVGIDRSVFPTVLSLVRALNEGRPPATPGSLQAINAAFALTGAGEANQAFREGVKAL